MSDHRIIRATLRGLVPNVVRYRDPKKTNWDGFRASIRRRIDGFKGKYGTPNELEHTEVFIRTVITTVSEENCLSLKKPLRAVSSSGVMSWRQGVRKQVGSLIERGKEHGRDLGSLQG